MNQHNRWIQCLNCGQEYSVDDVFHKNNQARCPGCASYEYIELTTGDAGVTSDYMSLNESLMKDGEWN